MALDVSQIKEYSLFPGQVMHATVTNPSGTRLIAHALFNDASPPVPPFESKLREDDVLQIVVACGPYTTSDNSLYEPFKDLLEYIGNENQN